VTLDEYQEEVRRTLQRDPESYPEHARFLAGSALLAPVRQTYDTMVHAMGLAGEAGEIIDLLKKHLGHGQPLDIEKAKKELGDVLWYVGALAADLGLSLSEVAEANKAKLRARYPAGFTVAAAEARADEGLPLEGNVNE